MKYLKAVIKKQKKYLKLFLFILGIGFIMGLFFYSKTSNSSIYAEIKNISTTLSTTHINYLFLHLLIIAFILLTSLTIIGTLSIPLYIIYEGFSLGYNMASLTTVFHFKGLIYSFIYILLTKGLYLILIAILFKKLISLIKYLINILIYKNTLKYNIYANLKVIIICLISIFLNDIIIYLFAHKILKYLAFIL